MSQNNQSCYAKKSYESIDGISPIVFLGSHNGHFVPPHLNQLGLSELWFDAAHHKKRHEACDWGIQPLFDSLIKSPNSDHSFIWGTYSRLVADLNRLSQNDHCFSKVSEDTGTMISGNYNISERDRQERLEYVYNPYMDALNTLVAKIRKRHAGAIILDMHSFTPKFNGQFRSTEVGLLKFEDHPLQHAIAEYLQESCNDHGMSFQVDYPYKEGQHETPKHILCANHDVFYTGIEIRNDCLETQEDIVFFSDMINGLTAYLQTHPKYKTFLKRSKTVRAKAV